MNLKDWKIALVVDGPDDPDKFRKGDKVFIKKTSSIGKQKYFRVYNPRTGYKTDSLGGWRVDRFRLTKYELDAILGIE